MQKKEDYWATPKEFLIAGYGDCEDYVIIKYFSLLKLGFDERKLFFTIVKENRSATDHMVLSYFKSPNKSPLILDNLSFKILNLKQRRDLDAKIFINKSGVYKLRNNKLYKVTSYSKQFKELKIRVNKEL